MRNYSIHSAVVLVALLSGASAAGQGQLQIINIPLSMPGEPMTLEISMQSARIEVIGEDRADAEFSVTVEQGSRKIITPSGTQAIPGGAYSLEIDEEDNTISVDTDWRANKVSIVARIPRRADLELSTINDGEIIVSNIQGTLELGNINGPITATNIAGSVIAETINGGGPVIKLKTLNGEINIRKSTN